MAINRKRGDVGYGLDNALQDLSPQPIVARRAPTVRDVALPGTVWINQAPGAGSSYTFIGGGPSNAVWEPTAGPAGSTFNSLITANEGFLQTDGRFTVDSAEDDDEAIFLNATNAAGGVTITGGTTGNITLTPAANTSATEAITLSARIGVATFTATTTASSTAETFTITNTLVSAASGIIVTVANGGTNDAQMTLSQVKPAAGSFEVIAFNNGAAALNGNVVISWIVLS